jgi:hypothetical protein
MATIDEIIVSMQDTDEQDSYSSLNDFLKFISVIEEKVIEGGLGVNQPFWDFKTLLTNMNECCVSGSSVLGHRIGKDINSKDIDLFINDTEENREIIQNFFEYDMYKLFFEYFVRNFLDTKIKYTRPRGIYHRTMTSNDAEKYFFSKGDFVLDPWRFGFDFSLQNGFIINIIFVRLMTKEEKAITSIPDSRSYSLYNQQAIFSQEGPIKKGNFDFLCFSSPPNSELKEYSLDKYPMAIPLHMIHANFDFMELKYVYSFDLMQPISIFAASKLLLQDYSNKLKVLKTNFDSKYDKNYIDSVSSMINGMVSGLAERNRRFVETYNDPDKLTISGHILTNSEKRILNRINNDIYNISSYEKTFDSRGIINLAYKQTRINEIYLKLLYRVEKYTNKGFNIVDPKNILLNIKHFLTISNLVSLTLEVKGVDNVIRQNSLFSGDRDTTKKLKSLLKITKDFEKIKKEVGIKHGMEDEKTESD